MVNIRYFLTGAISLLIGLTYYKSIKSVDLSGYSVNQISLNHGFNQKGFVVNKKIKLDIPFTMIKS